MCLYALGNCQKVLHNVTYVNRRHNLRSWYEGPQYEATGRLKVTKKGESSHTEWLKEQNLSPIFKLINV